MDNLCVQNVQIVRVSGRNGRNERSGLLTTSDPERCSAKAIARASLSRRLPEHWPPLKTTAQIHRPATGYFVLVRGSAQR